MTYQSRRDKEIHQPISGVVMSMIGIMSDVEENNINNILWNNEAHDIVEKCKQKSLKSYGHYGSKEHTYSFGNKILYGNVNGKYFGSM